MDIRPLTVAAAALLTSLAISLALAAPPAGAVDTHSPGSTATRSASPSATASPHHLTGAEATRIAESDSKVRETRRRYGTLGHYAQFKEPGSWQVDFYGGGKDVAQVTVDDASGTVREAWTGYQVAWQMARGYPGAFGHKLNAPYVWLPLAAIFLLALLDWRRPFRVVHLDLLVLLSFGISNHFLTQANIGLSVPLAYPPLAYLLARMLWIGFRRARAPAGPATSGLRPTAPISWLAIATAFLIAFRVALNIADSGVIDVGYSGVIGADRVTHGQPIYGANQFPSSDPYGDTYGPANYYAYVPFELALPWHGTWDDLPAGHAAAIFFDLATIAGLFMLGTRIRPGPRGQNLGVVLAFGWAAYPYTDYALQSNSNDALVAALLVWALVLFARPVARGILLALATMVKFVPLALAPLFAAGERGLLARAEEGRLPRSRLRPLAYFTLAFIAVTALMLANPVIDPGLATFWDRTLKSQIDRTSPFSIWGQDHSLEWLQTSLKVFAIGLAAIVAFIPRRRPLTRIAALAAAILIAVELTAEHWFYLYIPWFYPLLLAAIAADGDEPVTAPGGG